MWPAVYALFASCQSKRSIRRNLQKIYASKYAVDTLYTLLPEIHIKRGQE